MNSLDILAIAVHPDDIELSCAGTLVNHVRKGQKVGIVDLTRGELGTRGTPELRLQEAADAAKIMGIDIRENANMADGFFQNDEAHQRALMVFIRKYRPKIVLANALSDRHPDHGRAARLIADACFLSGLRKIETHLNGKLQQPWRPKRVFHSIQDRLLQPDFIVDISKTMDVKMEAIKAYKSQFHNENSNEPITYIATNSFLDQLKSRDSIVGKMIGVEYGEGFMCENKIGISDLDALFYPEMA